MDDSEYMKKRLQGTLFRKSFIDMNQRDQMEILEDLKQRDVQAQAEAS